ncbi:MAG: TIGR01212 family radical SAM protein, partial [Burkholderiales bacterium RIFOXYD2_FULL_59_8]
MVYFQAYSNTYAPVEKLRKKYDIIKEYDDIAAIAVGTRPDCIDEEKIGLLEEYSGKYEVWIELGLQSANNNTLKLINRNHSYEDFGLAVQATRKKNRLKVCAHVILGLPGEKEADYIDTAKKLAGLKVEGIKIHPLHVIKGTALEDIYNKKQYTPLKLEEYAQAVALFLEQISA